MHIKTVLMNISCMLLVWGCITCASEDIFKALILRNQTAYPIVITLVAKGLRNAIQEKFTVEVKPQAEYRFHPSLAPTIGKSTPIEIQQMQAVLPKRQKITYHMKSSFSYAQDPAKKCAIITIELRNKQLHYTYRVECNT